MTEAKDEASGGQRTITSRAGNAVAETTSPDGAEREVVIIEEKAMLPNAGRREQVEIISNKEKDRSLQFLSRD
jgi:hypothetical protein